MRALSLSNALSFFFVRLPSSPPLLSLLPSSCATRPGVPITQPPPQRHRLLEPQRGELATRRHLRRRRRRRRATRAAE